MSRREQLRQVRQRFSTMAIWCWAAAGSSEVPAEMARANRALSRLQSRWRRAGSRVFARSESIHTPPDNAQRGKAGLPQPFFQGLGATLLIPLGFQIELRLSKE